MNKPLITVIVPVYKVEDYLDECVQSLVNQTYDNLEIILVDDGSPDNCPSMCDSWAKRDHRIQVIHKENGGLSSARNAGLDAVTGDYVSFIDADDFIECDMYEKLLDAFGGDSKIGITSCLLYQYVKGVSYRYMDKWHIDAPREIAYEDFGRLLLTEKVNFVLCSKLFRRTVVDKARFVLGRMNEDSLYVFDLSRTMKDLKLKMSEIPYYGYYYRLRVGSICNSDNPLIPTVINNYQEMESKVKDSDPMLAKSLKDHWLSLLLKYYVRLITFSSDNELISKYDNEIRRVSIIDLWKDDELPMYLRFKYSILCTNPHLYRCLKQLKKG